MQILLHFRTGGKVDLKLIGGSKNSGELKISKRISVAKEVLLISESITGVFSREINLLTI